MEENENVENLAVENESNNTINDENTSSKAEMPSSENTQNEDNNLESEDINNTENSSDNSFKIVAGNGSEIEISPVHEHLNAMRPKTQDEKSKKRIIIPEVKKADSAGE